MSKPRLVYIVTDSISTRLLRGQLRHLVEDGFDVTVICSPGPELERAVREEGVRAVPVAMKRPIRPIRDLFSLVALFLALWKVRPHIVNAGTPKAALLGMIASWILRVPVRIYIVRGLRGETATGLTRRILGWTERISSFCATHILFVSKSLREVYLELGLGPARKAVVLLEGSSKGVDVERFRRTPERVEKAGELRASLGIPPKAPVIGFVGRVTRDKGADDLVAAFLRVEEEFPEAHLMLVGRVEADDSPSAATLSTIEGHPRIHLTGMVSDVAPVYQAMNFLVLPSYREGFPNVVLEASSAGRATIGYRSTGVVDAVVDGETGVLVPTGSSSELAGAMLEYLGNPRVAEEHGVAALGRVERLFAQARVFEAVAGFYEAALAGTSKLPALAPDR